MKKNKAVFLDRDGTILKDRKYLSDPDDIELYKGAVAALKKLKSRGWKLIIGTNQSGIRRGYFTEEDLKKVHDRLLCMFREQGLDIDEIIYCPHGPEDRCKCRKPHTGMIEKAAKKFGLNLRACVVVGDKSSDIHWGQRAGSRTVLVLTGVGKKTLSEPGVKSDYVARSLPYAAEWIIKNERN